MITTTKNLLVVLIVLVCAFNQDVYAYQGSESESVLLDGSKLTINGTSNVTDFECVYNEDLDEPETTTEAEIQQATATSAGGELILVVDSFDCGKKGINKDFRSTLKSDVYPTIHVELLEVITQDNIPTIAVVNISIVGITKEYGVELGEAYVEDGVTMVRGSQALKMTDFNIDPPRALFGLVKVDDELKINFTLRIR